LLPTIVRAVRLREHVKPGAVLTIAISGIAWTVLLGFFDSDLAHRRSDAALFREGEGHGFGIRDELLRYGQLSVYGSSPLRREFVGLCVLCGLAALAAWSGRSGQRFRRQAATSVGGGRHRLV